MYQEITEKKKAGLIEEVRRGLSPEDISGEEKLYSISGPGIHMEIFDGCLAWVVRAHSEREARFKIFALGTEFFRDFVASSPEEMITDSFAEEVLSMEDASCWSTDEAIGNCVY